MHILQFLLGIKVSGKFHILLFSFFYVFPYSYLTEECWSLERSAPSLKSHLNIYQELEAGGLAISRRETDTQNMNILVPRHPRQVRLSREQKSMTGLQ